MPWPRLRAFVKRLLRSRASEHALEQELRSYLEHETDANARTGLAPADARRAALVELGGVEQVKELVRDARSGATLDALWQDARYATRTLVHAPGFSLAVIASLAVGIGATVAAFGFVNAFLFRQLPGVATPDELVRVAFELRCGRNWCDETTLDESRVIHQSLDSLEGVAGELTINVAAAFAEPRSITAALVSENYFGTLGVRPSPGRAFAPGEGHGPAVAVISHALWRDEFNAAPAVIGRTIRVANETIQIIGVAPRMFKGVGGRREIWLPLSLAGRVAGGRRDNGNPAPSDGTWNISYLGRLPRGENLDKVRAQAGVLAAQLGAARAPARDGWADVSPWVRSDLLKTSMMFVFVMAVPCLVLIIGCINAASLLLARATHRGHEIAVRLAIGASRGRVARQLLLESVLLSLAAAAAALPAAWWGLRLAENSFGAVIPMDASVLASGLAAAVASAVGAGLAPALRVSARRPALALGAAHGPDSTPRQSRVRRALVAVQVAISIGLLMSGAQLVTAFEGLYESERVDPDRLVMASFDLGQLNFRESDTIAFYRDLVEQVRRLPQIEAAGLAGQTAFWNFARGNTAESLVMAWAPSGRPHRSYAGGYAGGDLFRALGLRLLQGRDFSDDERVTPRPLVAIVSRPFAEELFGPAALGQMVRVAAARSDAEAPLDVRIVGIVEPSWDRSYSKRPTPALFLPVPLEHQPALTLYARSRVPIGTLAPILRDVVRQIDPRVPIVDVGTLRQRAERVTPEAVLAQAVAGFGVVGSVLAAFGMYALFSYLVTMRARELAVRMALGADASRMLRLIVRQAMVLAAVGAAVGSPAAVVVAIVINSEFHGMQGFDVAKLAGTVAMFALTMLLASLVPAIRASRVDPISILKQG